MRSFHFKRGGVSPLHREHEGKTLSEHESIVRMPIPQKLHISLAQGTGAPAKPVVKVSDVVKAGQILAEPVGPIGNRVHAPTSGVVRMITEMPSITGPMVPYIILDCDGKDSGMETFENQKLRLDVTAKDIMDAIYQAGLTGMGGAGFPTYIKMNTPEQKPVEALVVNGAECEPYLTADHRMMAEQSERIIRGILYAMKAVSTTRALVGIEDNKPDAIEQMKLAAAEHPEIEVMPMRTKYPQGAEKQVIEALLNRQVPQRGLPIDCGVVVLNVSTCAAICDAVEVGKPLIERVVTVTGSVERPGNVLMRIGTTFEDAIAFCGGYRGEPVKLIAGGPMMGFAQFTDDVGIVKGTSGILVLDKQHVKEYEELPCIRCGKCVEVCPMGLQPLMIDANSRLGKFDMAEAYHAMDCYECGSCAYICPSKRHLVQSIIAAKRTIAAQRVQKKDKAGDPS